MIYRENLGRPLTWGELDGNFKEVVDTGQTARTAASSAQASAAIATSAQVSASASATDAGNSATDAKVEADRAKQVTGLNTVADAIGLAALPFPDVWIPLSDSLMMLSGYGREIIVGSDVVARYATLTRNTTATLVNKSGKLVNAATNEARFERNGLLVEPLMANLCQQSAFKGTSATNINEKWVTSSCSVLPSSAIGIDGVSNAGCEMGRVLT